jgi:hypothetical protein
MIEDDGDILVLAHSACVNGCFDGFSRKIMAFISLTDAINCEASKEEIEVVPKWNQNFIIGYPTEYLNVLY